MDKLITEIYEKCNFRITDFHTELEGKEYKASWFRINNLNIINRTAKITLKKIGQFVTFWKRNSQGITSPFSVDDVFDFYVINVKKENRIGQFIIPKSILASKGIVTTSEKDGKRGFRVYPAWDKPVSKQAIKSQQWQLNYFYEITKNIDSNTVIKLYKNS